MERGLIPPSQFIPVAEETGLILQIGKWALHEACRQMRQWQTESPANDSLQVSVNLSSKQFSQPDLIEQIARALADTGLGPKGLRLEITESVVMENIESATEMLDQLRGLGVESSIDDFGTGYSSLSYLHRFPSSTLKIDRSFVSKMNDHNENVEIIRTIIMLARNLGMTVVAEGVETREQAAQLTALECQYAQGYLFSRPLDSDAAAALISQARSRPTNLLPSGPFTIQPDTLVA